MKKIINFFKTRSFTTTLILAFIALIIIGFTYAWLTWSSTDNTNITMQIGEYTTITYVGGNAINVSNLAPVFNYTDGESTTFSLTNSNNDATKLFKYNVYLDVTTISNELKSTSFKYILLDGSSNIVDQGNFSNVTSGSTLTITENQVLPDGNSSYTFIIYIDGNEQNNSNMMNKSLTGSLRVVVVRDNAPTPISDFTYAIGAYNYNENSITVPEGEILLVEYNGSNSIVNIPATYVVNNIEYTPVVYGNIGESAFYENTNITEAIFAEGVLFADLSNDSNLTFNSILGLFKGCTSLTSVSGIPNTITNMQSTFYGCTSLVNTPTIPNSVTNMSSTFYGCTNLEGTVRINSSNISSATNTFGNTIKNIILEVPTESTTYNSFNGNVPVNVTLTTFTQ